MALEEVLAEVARLVGDGRHSCCAAPRLQDGGDAHEGEQEVDPSSGRRGRPLDGRSHGEEWEGEAADAAAAAAEARSANGVERRRSFALRWVVAANGARGEALTEREGSAYDLFAELHPGSRSPSHECSGGRVPTGVKSISEIATLWRGSSLCTDEAGDTLIADTAEFRRDRFWSPRPPKRSHEAACNVSGVS